MKAWNKAVLIPIKELVLTDWNANVMEDKEFAALVSDIQAGGFDEPCQVVPIKSGDDTGKYLVLGGEHRLKAARSLMFREIPCIIKEHLSEADEQELILWSVKRNNIRGKLDAQKYAKVERRLNDRYAVSAEAAKKRMLVRDEMLKKRAERIAEDKSTLDLTGDDELINAIGNNENTGGDTDGNPESARASGGSKDPTRGKFADRRALLQGLKAAEQEVLLQSEGTLDSGYLFFTQSGANHLVLNESQKLNELINEMVKVCKKNSDKIDDFLIQAISKQLELLK